MAAIGRIDIARRAVELPSLDSGSPPRATLDHLQHRASALDRLIGDAGPLGKFRTDAQDALPSGTSALTARIADTLVRVASRFDVTIERLLSGNPQLLLTQLGNPSLAHRIEQAAAAIAATQSVVSAHARPLLTDRLTLTEQPVTIDTRLDGAHDPTPADPHRSADRPAKSPNITVPAERHITPPDHPDVAANLRAHGLADLMTETIAPVTSPWQAPTGAILLYADIETASLALELRTPDGFAAEAVTPFPLSESGNYRLIAVFAENTRV